MGYFYEMDGLPIDAADATGPSPHPHYCVCLFCTRGRPTESFVEWQRRLTDAAVR